MKNYRVLASAVCFVLAVSSMSAAYAENAKKEEKNSPTLASIGEALNNALQPKSEDSEKFDSSYGSLIRTHARREGVPVALANAVVMVESNYNAKARGGAGEIGLMQIKLSTARSMGYRGSRAGLYDPATNLKYGMKYLGGAHKLAGGDTCGTILRYNAGHGAKRMNKISSRYCSKVKNILG